MQARPKILRILVVALIVSLVLGACGGGETGSTWFNLPSTRIVVREDGTASAYGINLGAILAPAQIQQFQAANIQRLEVRIGYNGIHVYVNGEDLPYLTWDARTVETLQDILPRLPQVPNRDMIARVLPWLRIVGLGVRLDIPVASGQAALDIERWNGETAITPVSPDELAIGPLVIGGVAFDEQGNAIIEGVPAETLSQALGLPPIQLPPDILALLQSLDVQTLVIGLQPNGVNLALNDRPLPGLAYNPDYLNRLGQYLPAFVQDPAQIDTINQALGVLPATDATIAVSFTGEAAAETEIMPVAVTIDPEGRVNILSIPVGTEPIVPPEVISNLQAAGVQQLDVALQEEGLFLAANGQPLPSITWTDESLDLVAGIVGPLAGVGAEGVRGALDIATGLGPRVRVNVAPGDGAEPVEPNMTPGPVEPDPQAPAIRLTLSLDRQGNITSLGGFTAEELDQLGISLPALPADVVAELHATGASEVQIESDPGVLRLRLDGQEAINVIYDTASLEMALQIARPFLEDSPLNEAGLNQFVTEQLLPMIPVADVNIVINLE